MFFYLPTQRHSFRLRKMFVTVATNRWRESLLCKKESFLLSRSSVPLQHFTCFGQGIIILFKTESVDSSKLFVANRTL